MARPLRIEFPGAVYHVTSRGNARQAIFIDDEDRGRFLDVLSIVVERFKWLCHAYCLVEKDNHLLSLCRYVVLNPVRVGLIKKPEQWRWSSYGATIGVAKRPSFLTVDWVLSQFGGRKRVAMERYRRFVMEGIDKESPWETLKGQIFWGTEEFIKNLSGLLDEKEGIKEVPRGQRYVARPPLRELFKGKKEKGRPAEDRTIYDAYVRYGYTMKEIAEHLGFHYATISRAIKRVDGG